MLNTQNQSNLFITINHELGCTLRGFRAMGDNLNSPIHQNSLNDAVDRAAVHPHPIPHIRMLNFASLNQQNTSRAIVN